MEWKPNDKMTITDLRAVLNSWGIPTLSSDKTDLQAEVSKHYKRIMQEWANALPDRRAIFSASRSGAAASSKGGHDQGVGTDTPLANVSYIGSEGPDDVAPSTPPVHENQDMTVVDPVSYTHLTLPTIYSV